MGVKEAIQECYNIEDNDQAMSCIKREIKEAPGCKPGLVLLVKEGCDGCKESKAAYREDIKAGIVRTVDIRSAEGVKIAKQNGIDTVPSFLVLGCDGEAIV
jgi:hypothetical protein